MGFGGTILWESKLLEDEPQTSCSHGSGKAAVNSVLWSAAAWVSLLQAIAVGSDQRRAQQLISVSQVLACGPSWQNLPVQVNRRQLQVS